MIKCVHANGEGENRMNSHLIFTDASTREPVFVEHTEGAMEQAERTPDEKTRFPLNTDTAIILI